MSRVRYAKGLRDLENADRDAAEIVGQRIRRVRCTYETDSEVAQAVVPKPLEANVASEICVSFISMTKHMTPDVTIEVQFAHFGVRVDYDGKPGSYLLTVPMSSEREVHLGREQFGEPAKLAEIEFALDDSASHSEGNVAPDSNAPASEEIGRLRASATRMGVCFLEATGKRLEELGPRSGIEYGYCFKAFPGCVPGKGFDHDPQLVRLEWNFDFTRVWRLEGEIQLTDSPFDPVADLPVRRIVDFEYAEGIMKRSGRALRPVPGDWLTPFIHQRYDEPEVEGVDI